MSVYKVIVQSVEIEPIKSNLDVKYVIVKGALDSQIMPRLMPRF